MDLLVSSGGLLLIVLYGALCRYVGNIHTKVTEALLAEVFSNVGPLEGCKLIRKEKVLMICYTICLLDFLVIHLYVVDLPLSTLFDFEAIIYHVSCVYLPFIVIETNLSGDLAYILV